MQKTPRNQKIKSLKSHMPPLATLALLITFTAIYMLSLDISNEVNQAASLLRQEEVKGIVIFLYGFGAYTPFASALMMILQTVSIILPNVQLIIANTELLGRLPGFVCSWIGVIAGSISAFTITRSLIHPLIFRSNSSNSGRQNMSLKSFSASWGVLIFGLHLLPFIPSGVVAFTAGLTPINIRQYVSIIAVSSIPTIIFYTLLGEDYSQPVFLTFRIALSVVTVALISFACWCFYRDIERAR